MEIRINIEDDDLSNIMVSELSQQLKWMLIDSKATTNEGDRKELEMDIQAFKRVLQYYTVAEI